MRELVDEVVLVSDEQMRSAIGHLALEEHVIAESAGAAATAALLNSGTSFGALPLSAFVLSPQFQHACAGRQDVRKQWC